MTSQERMDELLRHIKKELCECRNNIAELEALISERDAQLEQAKKELRGLYTAATLKFGTMTGPMAMEMAVPLKTMEAMSNWEVKTTRRLDQDELVVRVNRRGIR